MRLSFWSILICAMIVPSFADAKDLFIVHADGPNVHADYAMGNREAAPVEMVGYTLTQSSENAKFGRAIELLTANRQCTYDGKDNFNSSKGTVELWFRIESHEEAEYHPLFGWYRPPHQPGAKTRLSAMELYFHNDVLVFGLHAADHTKKYKGYMAKVPWTKNKWHHLEFNWDCRNGHDHSFYNAFVDGKNVMSVENAGALSGSGGRIHVGVWDYGFAHILQGQIDELRITDEIEHINDFEPPTEPYSLPYTLDRAKRTIRLATATRLQLENEVKTFLLLTGEQSDNAAGRVVRYAKGLATATKAEIGKLQETLKQNDPNPKEICISADSILSRLTAIRLEMYHISADVRKLADAEDSRSMLFKPINEELIADAVVLNGKQLFIDDHLLQETEGITRKLNQPVKHEKNPLTAPDQEWQKNGFYGNGNVIYDKDEKIFKQWLHLWKFVGEELASSTGFGLYLTSVDGINWEKPIINKEENNNRFLPPSGALGFCGQGIMKDYLDPDPSRRYKMIYTSTPPGKPHAYETGVAYSPDGITWTADPNNPVIPFGDTQAAPFWDARRQSYLGIVRTGPPNVRAIARIESKDFVHWSPKLTIFPSGGTNIDKPYRSQPYGMKVMNYEGYYIGFLNMYHWETISKIPDDMLFQDKTNIQLGYSRNGITWNRIGPHGEISQKELAKENDWKSISEQSVFIPYGEHKNAWDWGQVYAHHAPFVHEDKIWIYYTGYASRHWSNYHGDDRPPKTGLGLATLRLDGWVSVETESAGSILTKPIVAIGDTLVINANAEGGSIRVEAIDALGRVIPEFSKDNCIPITSDNLHHVIEWKQGADCHPLQGRPIQLKIYLENAKLYSVEFKTTQNHYIP